jgi:hypothetical protein
MPEFLRAGMATVVDLLVLAEAELLAGVMAPQKTVINPVATVSAKAETGNNRANAFLT